MKKLIACLFLMSVGANVYAGQIIPKINLDLPGTMKHSATGITADGDIDSGFGIGIEYQSKINEQFAIGCGLEYQMGRNLTKIGSSSYSGDTKNSFMPVYVMGKYLLTQNSSGAYLPFLKAGLGYSLSYSRGKDINFDGQGTTKGGLYYGLGGGFEINKKINVELMYSSYAGNYSYASYSPIDVTYTKFGLSVGYLFDLK